MKLFKSRRSLLLLLAIVSVRSFAEEPQLPAGLGGDEPALPIGADSGGEPDEPPMPAGLQAGSSDEWQSLAAEETKDESWLSGITGFWEMRTGYRVEDPIDQRHWSLAETRLKLKKDFHWQGWNARLTTDLLYDDIEPTQRNDLETGQGWLDLREAWVQRRLGENLDVKAGRQILTWGVGDLLFINDLFPKDWNSFLAGRDEQYLKAPSDAVRLGVYTGAVNINLVYTPRFDSDRYIDGRRLSFFSPQVGEVVGRDGLVQAGIPGHTGEDDEWALRLYRQLGSFEVALYAYDGFWKSPGGFNPLTGEALFPELRVSGASIRGPLGPGIFSAEAGLYDSRQDNSGTDPFINNSEWRGLLAYEWELAKDTTLGVQYYLEALQDYDEYRQSLFPGQPARDEYRQLVTARLTRLAFNQNLTWSLFAFVSPTDHDAYLRPKVSYKVTDNWLLEGGVNLFKGEDDYSFFGQFESNSNGYLAVRFSF